MLFEVKKVLLSEPLQNKCHGVFFETSENGKLYFMKSAQSKLHMNFKWYLFWISDNYQWDEEYWTSNNEMDTLDKIFEILNNEFQPSYQVPIVSLNNSNFKEIYDIGDVNNYNIVDQHNNILFSD